MREPHTNPCDTRYPPRSHPDARENLNMPNSKSMNNCIVPSHSTACLQRQRYDNDNDTTRTSRRRRRRSRRGTRLTEALATSVSRSMNQHHRQPQLVKMPQVFKFGLCCCPASAQDFSPDLSPPLLRGEAKTHNSHDIINRKTCAKIHQPTRSMAETKLLDLALLQSPPPSSFPQPDIRRRTSAFGTEIILELSNLAAKAPEEDSWRLLILSQHRSGP